MDHGTTRQAARHAVNDERSAVPIMRDIFILIGAIASEVLDVLREIQEAEARTARATERMADAVAGPERALNKARA